MEDSDDELPMISVSFHSLSQSSNGISLAMPSAEQVAAERARERQLDEELARLSQLEAVTATPARSSSSGSEGEAALAAAVRALHVLPASPARRSAAPAAARLAASLPAADFIRHYIDALQCDDNPALLKHLTYKISQALCNVKLKDERVSEDDMVSMAGIVCAMCMVAPSVSTRRLLHRLLQAVSEGAVEKLALLITNAVRATATATAGCSGSGSAESAVHCMQRVSDGCLAGVWSPSARRLADLLQRYALYLLLFPVHEGETPAQPPTVEELCLSAATEARRLNVANRLRALRLAARSRHAALVAALAADPPQTHKHHRDYHKVAVAASTFQLLFRTPNM